MTADWALLALLGGSAVATALAVVAARSSVRAVLAMVAHLAVTAALFLALQAPLLAMVQLALYAGAIMVLFLFMVMLLGGGRLPTAEALVGQRALAVPLAGALCAVLALGLGRWAAAPAGGIGGCEAARPDLSVARAPLELGSVEAIGDALFRQWVVPFEIVSLLLLASVIGAVLIAHGSGDAEDGPEVRP